MSLLLFFLHILLVHFALSHSLLSYPRPTAAKACRLGGVPQRGGISTCPGPCDVSTLRPPFRHITSATRPAVTVKRGEQITVKYQRNNHGPGGFVRHTLVPVSQMMNKTAHQHNAFHYSCWGANPTPATEEELGVDEFGFSIVGGDGVQHNLTISYYATNITIPDVVPDGVYVLGWTWYGGMGGSIFQNTPESPHRVGLFADYWSCSFVKVEGGARLGRAWRPVFRGGLEEFWGNRCMAANHRPGVCVYEPCRAEGRLRKPWEFEGRRKKSLLRPKDFVELQDHNTEGNDPRGNIPTPVPIPGLLRDARRELNACKRSERNSTTRVSGTPPRVMSDPLNKVLIDIFKCKERRRKTGRGNVRGRKRRN